jgi:hypothetical protein
MRCRSWPSFHVDDLFLTAVVSGGRAAPLPFRRLGTLTLDILGKPYVLTVLGLRHEPVDFLSLT